MWIMEQDREIIYKRTEEELHVLPRFNHGELYGFNLFMGDKFLGGFDTLEEAIAEMNAITACDALWYVVSGFSDYDGTDDFNALYELVEGVDYD